MKTLHNFDVTTYRGMVYEIGREKGFDDEKELEKLLYFFLEQHKDTLETKVHCLTCGVKFHLNDYQHDCLEEDIWLFQYVQNSVYNKTVKSEHISKIKEKYPLKNGNTLAFRGINFQSIEEYDLFMEQAKQGSYDFQKISSWSLSYDYAKRFALCIQKGTRADDTIRLEELRKMNEEKANMTGYKGIVLMMDISKKMVLCDISEESIGNMSEHEIILFPGDYSFVIASETERAVGQTEWNDDLIQKAGL
jgi:hypothetical protein